MAEEGSVFVDGIDAEDESLDAEDTTVEGQEEDINNSDSNQEDTENQSEAEEESGKTDSKAENTEDEESGEKVEKTEKGTKLDSDPLSRANQLRANAEAEVRQYHAMLNDPQRLEAYLNELKKERGESSKKDEPQVDLDSLDPSQLKTVEDLQKYALGLKQATKREIENVKKELSGITTQQKEESVGRRISDGITQVQTKYPELRELNADGTKNPQYVPELDDLVGELYTELDFDQKTGKYKGQVELMKIADRVMKARTLGEGAGSRKAKTDIIDKRGGRISGTQSKGDSDNPDYSKMSPSATIADRIRRAAEKRR